MDRMDRKILNCLQEDASLPISDIARRVGLSTTPCWKRLKRLENSGYIKGRVCVLSAEKVGLGVSVFVSIRTRNHNAEWAREFAKTTSGLRNVTGVYRMSGEVDYLLRVVVGSIEEYDSFYKELIGLVALDNVTSSFVMEEIKHETKLPL